MEPCTGIVLAGGRATRLGGVNKATLEVGGKGLLPRVVEALQPLCDQIVVVGHLADSLADRKVEVISDAVAGVGSLVGIYSGLMVARHDVAVVVGCDMPFLSTALLGRIAALSQGYDLAVPRVDGYLEALHAAYRRSCLPTIGAAIQRGNIKIIDFYPRVAFREVCMAEILDLDPELHSFVNINTLADLEKARAIASRR